MTKNKSVPLISLTAILLVAIIVSLTPVIITWLSQGEAETWVSSTNLAYATQWKVIVYKILNIFTYLWPIIFLLLLILLQKGLFEIQNKYYKYAKYITFLYFITLTYIYLSLFNLLPSFLFRQIPYSGILNMVFRLFSSWYIWSILGSIMWLIFGNILLIKSLSNQVKNL